MSCIDLYNHQKLFQDDKTIRFSLTFLFFHQNNNDLYNSGALFNNVFVLQTDPLLRIVRNSIQNNDDLEWKFFSRFINEIEQKSIVTKLVITVDVLVRGRHQLI